MWNEILSGLAGAGQGAVQGLGQIQDMRQQQIQTQLRERQQKLADDQAKRQAVQQAWESIKEGHSFEQPEQAKQFVELGYGVIKGPDGRLMKPKSVETIGREKQQKLVDLQTSDLERKQGLLAQITPDIYDTQSIGQRQVLDAQLSGNFDPLSPKEKLESSATLAAAQARAQVAAQEAGARQRRWEADHEFKQQQAAFAKQSKMTPSDYQLLQQAAGLAKANPLAAMDSEVLWQTTMANYQQLKGVFPQQAQQPQVPQGTPLVGPPGSGSKYTRIQ